MSGLRDRILEEGDRVFADKGYAAARVEDVIVAAGTSRATFYRYFSGKEDLFHELSLACFKEMREIVRSFSEVGAGGLEPLLAAYLDLHRRRGGVIRAWTERTAPPDSPGRGEAAATFGALIGEMTRAVEAAGATSRVDCDVRAALAFLAMERSSFYVTNRQSRVDPERLPATLATMLERAWFSEPPPPVAGGGRLRIAGG